MDAVLERLQTLEARIRATLAELSAARTAQESLAAKVQALEADVRSREQALTSLRAEREREGAEVARLRAERDEVRARVEGLLGEIGRLEGALQSPGVAGGPS
jgi:chromosome segregation ATPase